MAAIILHRARARDLEGQSARFPRPALRWRFVTYLLVFFAGSVCGTLVLFVLAAATTPR